MPKDHILILNDQLDIYLVQQKLKPSALAAIEPIHTIFDQTCHQVNLTKEQQRQIHGFLSELKVPYKSQPCQNESKRFIDRRVVQTTKINGIRIYVGQDQASLTRLVEATTDIEKGQALGYPSEDVAAYAQGSISFNNHIARVLQAKEAGKEIPSWLAYLSFVPAELDLLQGIIPERHARLGRLYRSRVQKYNPDLATKVETNFLEAMLTGYELMPDGQYALIYRC